MKIKISLLLISIWFNTKAQQTINVLECRYSMVKITGRDTIKMNDKTVRITSDKIVFWDYREGNIVLSSICDFVKSEQSIFLISNGSKHDFGLEADRKKGRLIYEKETFGDFVSNAKLYLPEDVSTNPFNNEQSSVFDTLNIDTTTKIAYYLKGGYRDFFDNGMGYLPVKTIRKVTTGFADYSIVTQLISKKEVLLTEVEWAKMLNYN